MDDVHYCVWLLSLHNYNNYLMWSMMSCNPRYTAIIRVLLIVEFEQLDNVTLSSVSQGVCL